eukprot:sb/3475775/
MSRLEEELTSMEGANTELQNLINTLTNEREELLDQVADRESIKQQLRDSELEVDHLKQELHELRQSESADLSIELDATKEECEQLKHSLTQLKISNDITQNEVWSLEIKMEMTLELKARNITN